LYRKLAAQSIASKNLSDRTVLILPGWIGSFVPIALDSTEVGKLFANAAIPAAEPGKWRYCVAVFQHLHLRRIATAEITPFDHSATEKTAGPNQNGSGKSFHRSERPGRPDADAHDTSTPKFQVSARCGDFDYRIPTSWLKNIEHTLDLRLPAAR
jgi:hypothetical protein